MICKCSKLWTLGENQSALWDCLGKDGAVTALSRWALDGCCAAQCLLIVSVLAEDRWGRH